jgi:hypothetical protein
MQIDCSIYSMCQAGLESFSIFVPVSEITHVAFGKMNLWKHFASTQAISDQDVFESDFPDRVQASMA